MGQTHYKRNEVATMLGISASRIAYTLKNGTLPRRQRRYLHHWYSAEEVVLLANYFCVPVPKQFAKLDKNSNK